MDKTDSVERGHVSANWLLQFEQKFFEHIDQRFNEFAGRLSLLEATQAQHTADLSQLTSWCDEGASDDFVVPSSSLYCISPGTLYIIRNPGNNFHKLVESSQLFPLFSNDHRRIRRRDRRDHREWPPPPTLPPLGTSNAATAAAALSTEGCVSRAESSGCVGAQREIAFSRATRRVYSPPSPSPSLPCRAPRHKSVVPPPPRRMYSALPVRINVPAFPFKFVKEYEQDRVAVSGFDNNDNNDNNNECSRTPQPSGEQIYTELALNCKLDNRILNLIRARDRVFIGALAVGNCSVQCIVRRQDQSHCGSGLSILYAHVAE
ncbi:unnamed protein product [Trichogramma brassicae]|uniref:Uncharacterized protein n=1 Tax=Trichogramma brassicae TaxID=86971 RepID=A0A6H5IDF2_9HYME|nr:unnamed protein product [Trichogramma brassicae]